MAKSKSLFILALFLFSMFGGPSIITARAQEPTTSADINTEQGAKALEQSLGQIFGMFREFGASGETLGMVLETMFNNFDNFSGMQSDVSGLYVLNASLQRESRSDVYQYDPSGDVEYWPLPRAYYNLTNVNSSYEDEFVYLKVNQTGSVNYTYTEGVQVVFSIWDNDGSFIDALDRMLTAVKDLNRLNAENATDDQKQEAINLVTETITYFLIHINDIITGDEIIMFNTIAYTNYVADFDTALQVDWFVSEDGAETDQVHLADVYPNFTEDFRTIAEANDHQELLYILNEDYKNEMYSNYTRFSFDIIELWLKNFEVHIDVEALLAAVAEAQTAANNGQDYDPDQGALSDKTLTDIFQGLDIEFYIFTHHFQNWYLYDDENGDGVPTPESETIGTYNNQTVEILHPGEIKYYLLFRGMNDVKFIEPTFAADGGSMTWGIRGENLGFRVIPIGLSDEDVNMTEAPVEYMDYFELGFTFEANAQDSVEDFVNGDGSITMGHAKVKLLQSFGRWNGDGTVKTPALANTSLDLTSVFMSIIVHVHLHIENKEIASTPEEATEELLSENNYHSEDSKVKVGDVSETLPLAEIDIAGPDYVQSGTNPGTYPAKTTTLPRAFGSIDVKHSETYEQKDNSTGAIDAALKIEVSMLIYATAYDTFDSSGDEIVHDPTFSVFITTQQPGVLAVILVVGVVALVGIAAVLITKKKNAQLGA